jgi:hypothetical protein
MASAQCGMQAKVTLVRTSRHRNQGRRNTMKRGGSRQRASGSFENGPMTGKQSSNIRFGRNKRPMSGYAQSSFSGRQRPSVPKKPAQANGRFTTRHGSSSKKAWQACFTKSVPLLLPLIPDAVFRPKCAN